MGHIFRELAEIPIPSEGRINHNDGIVSVYYKDGANKRQKTSIGIATSETMMQPNENFRFKFPNLWKLYYGKDANPLVDIHAGLYALTLGIGYQTNLYPLVTKSFGPQYGNAIMDYAMYCIENRSNVAQLFETSMEDRMLFSRKIFSDSWLSSVLTEKISDSQVEAFRREWASSSVNKGVDKVWLCIDGSNSDSDVSEGELPDIGHAKSHQERKIISYLWAVNSKDGRPVTWFVNNGSTPDCKAVDEAIRFLASLGIGVEGVILDRGFATREVFDLIRSKGLHYIAMLKSNTTGFATMFDKHYKDIRWDLNHVVDDDVIFGIADTVPVFAGETPSSVALFFCGDSSARGGKELITKVRRAMRNLQQKINKGEKEIEIEEDVVPYIELVKGDDGRIEGAKYRMEIWQKVFDGLGYHAIASSYPYSAEEIYRFYKLRDASEKQFSIMKTQLGFHRIRSHGDQGIKNRIACAFIASIIRAEILSVCKSMTLDTNVMIRKVNHAILRYMPGDRYEEIRNIPSIVKKLLGRFGIEEEHFKMFAMELNQQRVSVIQSPIRVIPELNPLSKSCKRSKIVEENNEADTPRRKAGRPKGSKNKKTIEKELEAQQHPEESQEQPRRKAGRPKGSKNKKTIEKELEAQQHPEESQEQPRRKAGRPKGSKNKKTIEKELEAQQHLEESQEQPQQKAGRPKGSKNKKTIEKELETQQHLEESQEQPQQKAGSPKESKNKKRIEKELEAQQQDTSSEEEVQSKQGQSLGSETIEAGIEIEGEKLSNQHKEEKNQMLRT